MDNAELLELLTENALTRDGKLIIESTSAIMVKGVKNPLYNVSKSSNDPRPGGTSWVDLFYITMDKASGTYSKKCFVDPKTVKNGPPNTGGNHDDPEVGGHMTNNADNSVSHGTCFLMPLCKWHNHYKRNHLAYTPIQNTMVQLGGYMPGEPAALFAATLDAVAPYVIVHSEDGGFGYMPLADEPRGGPQVLLEREFEKTDNMHPASYIALRRTKHEDRFVYEIAEHNLA